MHVIILLYCFRVTLGDEDVKLEEPVDNVLDTNLSRTSTTTAKGVRKRRQVVSPSGPDFHLGSASSENVPSYSRATVIQHNENRPSTSSGSQGNVSRW